MTAVTACLLTLFLGLGHWQWSRAETKRSMLEDFQATLTLADGPVIVSIADVRDLSRYSRVRVRGRWDIERQFLLDNRTRDGRAGFEVLTPFQLEDGHWLLVNRGWLPFEGFRDRLPDLKAVFSEAALDRSVTVAGRLDELPRAGLPIGRSAPAREGQWPRITSFPEARDLALSLDLEASQSLETRQLLLDGESELGYRRDWQPFAVGKGPEQNWSYAIQWWSFAVVLLILYVSLNLRRQDSGD